MRSTKIKKNCSSSLWTCLHHMVILRTQNKITDFFMILAWASPFNNDLPTYQMFYHYLSNVENIEGVIGDKKVFLPPYGIIKWE